MTISAYCLKCIVLWMMLHKYIHVCVCVRYLICKMANYGFDRVDYYFFSFHHTHIYTNRGNKHDYALIGDHNITSMQCILFLSLSLGRTMSGHLVWLKSNVSMFAATEREKRKKKLRGIRQIAERPHSFGGIAYLLYLWPHTHTHNVCAARRVHNTYCRCI